MLQNVDKVVRCPQWWCRVALHAVNGGFFKEFLHMDYSSLRSSDLRIRNYCCEPLVLTVTSAQWCHTAVFEGFSHEFQFFFVKVRLLLHNVGARKSVDIISTSSSCDLVVYWRLQGFLPEQSVTAVWSKADASFSMQRLMSGRQTVE